jgi:hypothetical protein
VFVRFDHVASIIVNANHGVEPVFLDQKQAIDYATGSACFRSGEIRILDATGGTKRIIPFSDADRKL